MSRSPEDRFWDKVRIPSEVMSGCWLWAGAGDTRGYGDFKSPIKGSRKSHRIAWRLIRGDVPQGSQLDHLCHNRRCVNPAHLRVCSQRENSQNLSGKTTGRYTSTLPGASWNKRDRSWQSFIWLNGKNKYLGTYETEQLANAAYVDAVNEVQQQQQKG